MILLVKNKKEKRTITIDDEDYIKVSKHRWYVNNQGTVVTYINNKWTTIHSYLLGKRTENRQNFYIDGNKFNCSKLNISIGKDIKKVPKKFERECPNCGVTLFYRSQKSYYNSSLSNCVCRSCTQLGHNPWNKGLNKESDERIKLASEQLILSGNRKNKKSWNTGLTSETDERVKNNTESTRKTLLQLHKEGKISVWNKGKPFPQVAGKNSPTKRPEVREKMAIAALKNVGGKTYKCAFNPKACELFDEINREMGWSGIHALNNSKGEYRVFGTWFQVDFYEPMLNIVIEYYEKRGHNRTKQKAKDIVRQQKIIDAINCHFYIIKEGEENLWRQTINKPFWLQDRQDSLDLTSLNIA